MTHLHALAPCMCLLLSLCTSPNASQRTSSRQLGGETSRRVLRVALYPYVPQSATIALTIKTAFEDRNSAINIHFVDLADDYYDSLPTMVADKRADVFEVDGVFLDDLVRARSIEEMPLTTVASSEGFLPFAWAASVVKGKLYAIPHWVCGNFLLFRRDDPAAVSLHSIRSLSQLETVIGRPAHDSGLFIDLWGRSTLGEEYLDAMTALYRVPSAILAHTRSTPLDSAAVHGLRRTLALCAAGFCKVDQYHSQEQFYPRQFAHGRARALVGYSERLYYVIDEALHDSPLTERAIGSGDIDAALPPFADSASTLLAWVDMMIVPSGLDAQTRDDAFRFVRFMASDSLMLALLIPSPRHAPLYLLPARAHVYSNSELLKAAPLYGRFFELLAGAVTVREEKLNDRLRSVGKILKDSL